MQGLLRLWNDLLRIQARHTGNTPIKQNSIAETQSTMESFLKKANKILTGDYLLPEIREYLDFDATNVYDKQLAILKSEEKVYVLNTCIFALVDFAPRRFYGFLKQHATDLDI